MKVKPSNWNIANVLTVLRIIMVPLMGWTLLAQPDQLNWRLASALIFVIAMITDFIDGQIARRYNLVTDFGKLWDPAADKLLTGMAFVGLSILGELSWWITGVILVREWGITLLRAVMVRYGVMAANRGGKLKTVVQTAALILFLPGLQNFPQPIQVIGWVLMIVAFALTVVTGFVYAVEATRMRRAGATPPDEQMVQQ